MEVVIAIAMCVRPWNEPENTTTWGRPVACLASFTAASVISAPELAKKNVDLAGQTKELLQEVKEDVKEVKEHVQEVKEEVKDLKQEVKDLKNEKNDAGGP